VRQRISSIDRLPDEIREAVDAAIRERRATIDEIVCAIREMGGDVSRSAVGRYAKRAREQMTRYREAQEIAKVWVGKLQAEPSGDVARLLSEMLKTVAFQVSADLGEEASAKPMDVMLLAKALRDIGSFEKVNAERELRVRRETAEKAAETAVSAGRRAGVSPEALETIRREVYGIVRPAEATP
jgi:DNA-binding transcriptional ArsR family regulator